MATTYEALTEDQRLHAFARDLIALSAMASWWSGHSLPEIAESVRDLLAGILDAERVDVRLQDPESGEPLVVQLSPSRSEEGAARHRPQQPGDDPAGLRLASFPIGLEGELGCLSIGACRPGFPHELDSLLLRLAANQIAVALQHAAKSIRAEQQAAVVRLGLRALTGIPLDQLLQETAEVVRETLRVDLSAVLELTEDGTSLLVKAGAGWRPGIVGRARIGVGIDTQAGYALQQRAPVVVSDLRGESRFNRPPVLLEHEVVSGISVIIHDQTGSFGVLSAHTRQPRVFSRDHVHFLQLIANLLGAARQRERAEAEREELLARTLEAQAEAERASRSKSDFLAMMSHELRTPLNAIAGYAELLELGVHGPVTVAQSETLARIRRSQRYLLGLINNVLTFMKLGSGRVQFDISSVPVDGILDTVEEMIRPQMAAKRLRFELHGAGRGVRVEADPERLQQVVLNLLSNASKFTDPGGSVRLECRVAEETVSIRVQDTGCGIPAAKLEAVFDPYVQVEDTASRNAEGTGLGLAISRDFARGMGGEIRAESEPGNGSVFTVELRRSR
ncbi:MAG: GAF domain-containing sensor histidine kinase [Gemmatimonadetes bacterium]|nr:GAF domain-containing sensor histidine kinase [Gemmatimonadota bacterium]